VIFTFLTTGDFYLALQIALCFHEKFVAVTDVVGSKAELAASVELPLILSTGG